MWPETESTVFVVIYLFHENAATPCVKWILLHYFQFDFTTQAFERSILATDVIRET